MQTISMDVIDRVWDRINELSDEENHAMSVRIMEKQPAIMVYLLAMDEHLFEEEARGRLLELGAYIMEIMYDTDPDLPIVGEEDLEHAEKANLGRLEELEEGSEMEIESAVQTLFQDYNQMPLLGAILEGLMAGYEDEPEMAPENTGMAMIYLKTVIDCLDQKQGSPD